MEMEIKLKLIRGSVMVISTHKPGTYLFGISARIKFIRFIIVLVHYEILLQIPFFYKRQLKWILLIIK